MLFRSFMKGVEEVTGSISESAISTVVDSVESVDPSRNVSVDGEAHVEQREAADETGTEKIDNPWTGLLQQGAALLQQLATASSNAGGVSASNALGQSFVHRDVATGESYLRIPLPASEVLEQTLRALASLLESMRR